MMYPLRFFILIFIVGIPISMSSAVDLLGSEGHIGSSVGLGISVGSPGWEPTKLVDITRDPQYNKLATFFLADYQSDYLVFEGRYGFSTNLGIFANSAEYENHLSALVGLATPPGFLNASLLTGLGITVGSRHGKLVSSAYFNNTYETRSFIVPGIPFELNVSMLLWGWGLGLQYHGELNTEFTSTGFYLVFRHQSQSEGNDG